MRPLFSRFVVLFSLFSSGVLVLAQSGSKAPSYVVISYVTDNGWMIDQIDAQKLTHINYAESFDPKVAYVKAKQLAGVMFWEYTYDLQQKETLLDALVQDLAKS